jgi:lipopolysaccharide biosynthesis glycosyltransferase
VTHFVLTKVRTDQLKWPDTFDAEYIALTKLQADAFITLDGELASAVKDVVALAPFEVLSRSQTPRG